VSTVSQFGRYDVGRATDFTIRQRVNDHSQSRQRFIDLLRFLQRLTSSSSLTDLYVSSAIVTKWAADLLGSSQIDEVQMPILLTPILGISLMNSNDKDGM
jgi:hypothetical protein